MNPVYVASYGIEYYINVLIAAESVEEAYGIASKHFDHVDFDSVKRIDAVVTHMEKCVIEEI